MSDSKHYDVIIIGSGPAGYTAGIYTGRASLKTLIIEGIQWGGQLMITSELENFPGFPEGVMGPDFMELLRNQAKRFGAELLTQNADKAALTEGRPYRIEAGGETYTCDTLIVSTGATARFLGIPSETEYKGKGVSACATCDGFFFRDKEVIVVGGGDTALEEAIFLTKFASKVTIVHRRDVFRASQIMVERAESNEKIEIKTFQVIDEIYGDTETGTVSGVKLKDPRDDSVSDYPAQGVFVAIGHDPNTKLFEGQLKMNEEKYLITQAERTATNIPGVFAAGDVKDPFYRQAITAAGSGCQAAIEAEKYLEEIKG